MQYFCERSIPRIVLKAFKATFYSSFIKIISSNEWFFSRPLFNLFLWNWKMFTHFSHKNFRCTELHLLIHWELIAFLDTHMYRCCSSEFHDCNTFYLCSLKLWNPSLNPNNVKVVFQRPWKGMYTLVWFSNEGYEGVNRCCIRCESEKSIVQIQKLRNTPCFDRA